MTIARARTRRPSNLLLGANQIQEATVVTIGYSGQFGRAAGTNINFITKSGGNQFHGNTEYFWNGTVFNANDWLSNAFGSPRAHDVANQWAGSFGGPITKEKLFFFFDSEGLRILLPSVNLAQIPSLDFETATITNIENDKRFGYGSKTDLFYKKIFGLYNSSAGPTRSQPGVPGRGSGCGADFTLPDDGPCTRYFLYSPSELVNEALTSGRIDWNVANHDRAFLRIQHDGGRNPFFNNTLAQNNSFGGLYAVPLGPFGSAHACGEGAAGPHPLDPCQPQQLECTPNSLPSPKKLRNMRTAAALRFTPDLHSSWDGWA